MSEEQSILINIVKDCVFVVRLTEDNQPGRFVRVNDAACSLLGYSAEEFAEMTPGDIESPEAAGLSAEQAARELWKNEHAVFETVLVAKSGIKIMVEINARICRLHGAAHIVASAIDRTGRREADEYLRENETRLSLAMDATNTGMWDWHVQTGEVVFNEKWAEIAGYTLKELQPVTIQTWMNLCHPEDLESSNRKLEKYFAGETDCYECEARIKHKNGSWRWIHDRGKVVEWDDEGRPLRMIGTHTDIHLRKKYEQELKKHVRELNERNKELNCLFAISRMVEDPGHCLDDIIQNTINILAASMQYPEYACGRIRIKDHDYLTENFTETSWKLSRDILVNGYPEGCIEIFYLEPGPETGEGPFLREEKNLLKAVAERLGHIIGRIRTEEKLRRSEQKFKDIFNSTGDAIFIHDMEGNFLEVNEVACRRLGYSREELLRMTPMDLDTQEYRELAPERIQTIVQDGINVFESAHRRKDGTVIPVEINSRKIEYEGKLRILSIARDITERREKEMLEARLQEAQRIESIGRLAGGVAHDLNNMLAPVLGYAELLIVQANPVDPDIIEPLNEILTAGKRARDLVGQLLAFGRKQMLEFEPVNLNLVVQRLNNLIRKTIREDIRININTARSLPDIKGDSSQLERVIMNLVLNAQDAMPRGGVLTIETAMVLVEPDQDLPEEYSPMPPGSYVMLELSDTGHGMDRETMKQVFEPFFTTKEMDKGSGLGLATSYGIIKQHGGEIRVSSKEGTGTTFKIYLPAYYGNSEQARDETKLSADTGAAAKGSETILLVEDEKNVRDLAVKALQQLGYRVVEASNGHEAISLLASRREPVDLLVTDVIMPGLNGGQLYEEISSLRPDLRVLYMSGYTDDVLFSYGLTETDTHFIRKPFSIKEFAASVRKALGQ